MLQIKKLNLTHKKDLRIILNDFNLVLNDPARFIYEFGFLFASLVYSYYYS